MMLPIYMLIGVSPIVVVALIAWRLDERDKLKARIVQPQAKLSELKEKK